MVPRAAIAAIVARRNGAASGNIAAAVRPGAAAVPGCRRYRCVGIAAGDTDTGMVGASAALSPPAASPGMTKDLANAREAGFAATTVPRVRPAPPFQTAHRS
jgi:hypothetical protein